MPVGRFLIGVSYGYQFGLAPGAPGELNTCWQAVLAETIWHCKRRLSHSVSAWDHRRTSTHSRIGLVKVDVDRISHRIPRWSHQRIVFRIKLIQFSLHRTPYSHSLQIVDRQHHGRRIPSPSIVDRPKLAGLTAFDQVPEC